MNIKNEDIIVIFNPYNEGCCLGKVNSIFVNDKNEKIFDIQRVRIFPNKKLKLTTEFQYVKDTEVISKTDLKMEVEKIECQSTNGID